jgi:hypothetical protein
MYEQPTTDLPFANIPPSQWTQGMIRIAAERGKELLAEDRAQLRDLLFKAKLQAAHEAANRRAEQPQNEEEEFQQWWANATPAERAKVQAEAEAERREHLKVQAQFAHAKAKGRRHAQEQAEAERRRQALAARPIPGQRRAAPTRTAAQPFAAALPQTPTLQRAGPYMTKVMMPYRT